MANSFSSSQGLDPDVLGKGPQTPGDLMIYSLEDLKGCDFKKFKNKLSDFPFGDKLPIPRGRLENADWITTKDVLINTYGEEGALDVMIKVFTLTDLMGPANYLQERRAHNAKLKNMTQSNKLSELAKEYRESAKGILQRIKEYNSRMGESINLRKRYTKLFMRNGPPNKKEKEQEIRSTGRRHLQVMEKRSSDEYSPTTIQALFDPDEDGCIPNIVVLQGPAGIGKTMTSKKIMLDWAFGNLYQDKFDFVFYLSCREINTINRNISLVELLSRTCRLQCSDDLVSILKDPESHRKLLFIVDGFDELRWTVGEESETCNDVFEETHKEIILQRLLRKQILQQSSLIITTRSLAINKLDTFIDSRNVEIQGFTREDREEYVHKFFGNKEDADKVLSIIKDNEVVYTMCAVPIICWIACTVMKQEIKKDLGLIQFKTMTSIYLLYLEVLITHHSKKDPSVHWIPQAIHTCLKKLCALANEGILNQQILFENKDLERHGLSLSEVESVFLNENIFDWEVRTQTCYSFIHLSVQEFLAALYYVLDDGSGFTKITFLPEICKGKSLDGFSSGYPHLALAVQFLFGLLNEKQVTTFSESTGINISLRARSAMKEWTVKDIKKVFPTFVIFCLYETQDDDIIRSVMSKSSLLLHGSRTGHLWMNTNYSKQLSYCLKTLKSECVQSLYFGSLTVDPECQKNLSPLLHLCQEVRFQDCIISRKNCMGEGKAEDEEVPSSSEDEMKPSTISWLINPESKIRKLCFNGCDLAPFRCDDLHSILTTNRSLIKLDLTHINLQDSGMKCLCEGLTHSDCILRELRVCDSKATLLCFDDLCSAITTNQTLTRLEATLDVNEKMSGSEIDHRCEVLQQAGFTVYRDIYRGGRHWVSIFYKRRWSS
ncbi:NACHT, LRR and PYD domains-containing protein 3-like [Rana temporaria]|uniref:NACHT, LRR and PYD domains-containing protein 3-like n=1 Tax=Rana temporaria TaxID=8407 RepID=UPI001AAC7B38|nr:NACHT, LRR and PYD domains-containing protein 3-like [Rana temporaria]